MIIVILFFCLEIEAIADSLVFVHILFRHGDRTPEKSNLYPASQYYDESHFKPHGFGQLTNQGKLTTFKVGQELRKRYNGFLDETYNINLIDARSSDFNRTKASLQAMLAGLLPPSEELIWLKGMNWQPIATTYVEREFDKELFFFGCPAWKPNANSFQRSGEGQAVLPEDFKRVSKFLTDQTGKKFNSLRDVSSLYRGFTILEKLNKTLPAWSRSVYPDRMKNTMAINYFYMIATPILRQMAAGFVLKKILRDTDDKINGKVPLKKMSIMCGHEYNIASLLRVLNICENYNSVPPYGSYILFELHRKDNEYGFKIFYQDHEDTEPKLMKLPECEEFCPLVNFKRIVAKDIPANDEVCRSGEENSCSLLKFLYRAKRIGNAASRNLRILS